MDNTMTYNPGKGASALNVPLATKVNASFTKLSEVEESLKLLLDRISLYESRLSDFAIRTDGVNNEVQKEPSGDKKPYVPDGSVYRIIENIRMIEAVAARMEKHIDRIETLG